MRATGIEERSGSGAAGSGAGRAGAARFIMRSLAAERRDVWAGFNVGAEAWEQPGRFRGAAVADVAVPAAATRTAAPHLHCQLERNCAAAAAIRRVERPYRVDEMQRSSHL
jgi:hypothetical protein